MALEIPVFLYGRKLSMVLPIIFFKQTFNQPMGPFDAFPAGTIVFNHGDNLKNKSYTYIL